VDDWCFLFLLVRLFRFLAILCWCVSRPRAGHWTEAVSSIDLDGKAVKPLAACKENRLILCAGIAHRRRYASEVLADQRDLTSPMRDFLLVLPDGNRSRLDIRKYLADFAYPCRTASPARSGADGASVSNGLRPTQPLTAHTAVLCLVLLTGHGRVWCTPVASTVLRKNSVVPRPGRRHTTRTALARPSRPTRPTPPPPPDN